MSEIGISGYPFLQGGNKTEEDYSVATTFGDADIIVFNKIPKRQYGLIESWIEEIIEHETIHILLHKLRVSLYSYQKRNHLFEKLYVMRRLGKTYVVNPKVSEKESTKVKP